jgi:hypothetical protein
MRIGDPGTSFRTEDFPEFGDKLVCTLMMPGGHYWSPLCWRYEYGNQKLPTWSRSAPELASQKDRSE